MQLRSLHHAPLPAQPARGSLTGARSLPLPGQPPTDPRLSELAPSRGLRAASAPPLPAVAAPERRGSELRAARRGPQPPPPELFMAAHQQSRIQAYLEKNKIGPLFEVRCRRLLRRGGLVSPATAARVRAGTGTSSSLGRAPPAPFALPHRTCALSRLPLPCPRVPELRAALPACPAASLGLWLLQHRRLVEQVPLRPPARFPDAPRRWWDGD